MRTRPLRPPSGPRLIRSPVVLGQLVDVLYYLLVPSDARRNKGAGSLLGGSGWGGDVGGRLSAVVLGESAVRVALAVPLAAAYSAFDAVEGLRSSLYLLQRNKLS